MQRIFHRFLLTGLLAISAACLTACSSEQGNGKQNPSAARGPVVLAASSLQDALEEAADAWAHEGHARPVLSFAGSSSHARQIESGAPADIFISADEDWMDVLDDASLLKRETRADLLGNQLVLIGRTGNGTAVDLANPASLTAALGCTFLAMGDPDTVPAGRYGRQALQTAHLWAAVRSRIARTENVRAALALVENGGAQLGIVYATDAAASDKVRILADFPAASHAPIRYPIAVLAGSPHADAAGLRDFLLSDAGQLIFARHGFTAP